jgi:hypothetical protein
MNKVSIDAGDGFAREARTQFVIGTISSSNGWFARRFWK